MLKKHILFVVNDPAFFVSHRLAIAQKLIALGVRVGLAAPAAEGVDAVLKAGIEFHRISLSRSSKNPFVELNTLAELYRLYRTLSPDLVHHVTPKPNLYGGIAARLSAINSTVFAVSGLGYMFISRRIKDRIIRRLVQLTYRASFSNQNQVVIFQNSHDLAVLKKIAGLSDGDVSIIRGSGVDLAKYRYPRKPMQEVDVTMACRILVDKGVNEFLTAVEILRERGFKSGVRCRFQLAGSLDSGNPASLSASQLKSRALSAGVDLLGQVDDIPELLSHCSIAVLPSYREGLPKFLIEAAAAGCAVVTTDVPGCRDAIEPGVSGVLVPVRDSEALADALEKLINDRQAIEEMGSRGRELAVREYSLDRIVGQHLKIYEKLLDTNFGESV